MDYLANFNCSEAYNCTDRVFQNCFNQLGFDFPSLQNITQIIRQYCPTDPRLFLTNNAPATANNAALTNKACKTFAPAPFTLYSPETIWARLQTWKIPLFQLALSTPRPPLGLDISVFVLVHLMGDPMGTIKDLREKLSRCEEHAVYFERRGLPPRVWKALAMICVAYDESGQGYAVREILGEQL
jgi:hypothetical protein